MLLGTPKFCDWGCASPWVLNLNVCAEKPILTREIAHLNSLNAQFDTVGAICFWRAGGGGWKGSEKGGYGQRGLHKIRI